MVQSACQRKTMRGMVFSLCRITDALSVQKIWVRGNEINALLYFIYQIYRQRLSLETSFVVDQVVSSNGIPCTIHRFIKMIRILSSDTGVVICTRSSELGARSNGPKIKTGGIKTKNSHCSRQSIACITVR